MSTPPPQGPPPGWEPPPGWVPPGYGPPPKKKTHKLRWALLGLLALFVVIGIASAAGGGSTTTSTPQSAAPDTHSASNTASSAAPSSRAPSSSPPPSSRPPSSSSAPLSSSPPSIVSPTTSAPSSPPPSSASKPAVSAGGTVLLTIAGSGTKSTQKFTTGSDWDLAWTYDCKAFGASGNFIVSPTASDPMTLVSPVNQLGASGASVEHYHDGGTFYLDINSECAWTVKVTTA